MTESDIVSIDEPADGYMEMMEYRNSARGHLIALENNEMLTGRNYTRQNDEAKGVWNVSLFQNACKKVDQLASLPWRAVILRQFEEEMPTTPKIRPLNAIPYAKTVS